MTPTASSPTIVTANVSRRHFLGGVFSAGAFVVAARFVPESPAGADRIGPHGG